MLLTPLLLLTPMVGFKYKTGSKQNNEFLLYICILTIKKKKNEAARFTERSSLSGLKSTLGLDVYKQIQEQNITCKSNVFFAC